MISEHGTNTILGTGSDFLVKVLHASRVWCLVLAAGIFSVAQM